MKKYSRRNFLEQAGSAAFVGAGLSLFPALSGCSSIDQHFSTDSNYMSDRVVILGAGISGLAAAYHLKKNKVPYCIFEASRLPGGRISTARVGSEANEVVELGADHFEKSHRHVFALCRELGLKMVTATSEEEQSRKLYWANNKSFSSLLGYQKLFQKLAETRMQFFGEGAGNWTSDLRTLSVFDEMSAKELIERSSSSSLSNSMLEVYHQGLRSSWGVDPENLSALQFLDQYDIESSSQPFPRGARFSIEGGNARLIDTLIQRLDSAVPGYLFKTQHQLVALRPRTLFTELIFDTPEGRKSFFCKKIICTLPVTALRAIEGWNELGTTPEFQEGIQKLQLGTHAKFALEYQNPFWMKGANLATNANAAANSRPAFSGDLLGEVPFQRMTAALEGRNGGKSVLLMKVGGEKNPLNEQLILQSKAFLNRHFPESERLLLGVAARTDWKAKQHIGGSKSFYAPFQNLRFRNIWKQEDLGNYFVFAGEHTSQKWQGTVNGAIETGIQAAERYSLTNEKRMINEV